MGNTIVIECENCGYKAGLGIGWYLSSVLNIN